MPTARARRRWSGRRSASSRIGRGRERSICGSRARSPTTAAILDGDQIKQVILNILVNAQQAITGSGRISIESRVATPPGDAAKAALAPLRVEIVFADTGCGISPANLERIFDPFFTSKEVGKGTGLGLSVSYGIVRAHGGEITVESTVDVGTTFHVFLPVVATDDEGRPKSS